MVAMAALEGHVVSLKLGPIDFQGTVEPEGRGDGGDDLND